jgi:toxin ParE1/3/4
LGKKAQSALILRIRWSVQASKHLEASYDYVFTDNPTATEKQLEAIKRAIEQLRDFPEMGRPGRIDGTRELIIQGTPYIAAYRIKRSSLTILALLHGAALAQTNVTTAEA